MWISQELKVGLYSVHLFETHVMVESRIGDKKNTTHLCPTTRDDANRLSIALRMASKRIEEIGKGMR